MTTVLVERRDDVAIVTLNRPERLNAFDDAQVDDLLGALDELAGDRGCRVVVLTGAGRGFSAGADISPSNRNDPRTAQSAWSLQKRFSALTLRLHSLPQPVIAAVNGPAAGGGLALVLAADIRIAAASARFNVAFIRVGFSGCDMGTGWLLPRIVGAGRAHELLLTGRIVDAEEAARIGLVLEVVPDGTVVDRALEEAALITRNTPFGVAMTKEVMWADLEIPSLSAAIDLENRTQVLSSLTQDAYEAMAAFVEKRPPVYRNH
jgi:enoyl-CoA hydratase